MKNFKKLETTFSRQSPPLSNSIEVTKITSIHIRSTDKRAEAKIIKPEHYFKVLKHTCLVHKYLCTSNLSWIATDSDGNRETFSSLLKNDSSMRNFRTLGIHVDGIVKRYSPQSLLTILTDLDVLSKSR